MSTAVTGQLADLLEGASREAWEEAERACEMFPPLHSGHEAWAVIREELDEFWSEVKRKRPDPRSCREELRQTAAMCLRAMAELYPEGAK